MSAMATREQMLAEEARREFRSAKADSLSVVKMRSGVDFGAFAAAFDALHSAWLRWEIAAKAAGLDPSVEAPEWLAPATTILRIPAEDRLTWDDLRLSGWYAVEHEAVPDGVRNALLAILGWDEGHRGGVFARYEENGSYRYTLVTWVADGRGDVRQQIALQVPICTHDVPLAEGCSVCGVGGRAC